ncbi:crossover junction endodeoxyribonuclease RuvC [Lutispora sp.]|uniref:crossover junction endodeoxyribonuclease RuvC n=1 Tax=Lutispora sp. TaxID=2828727 RepID=UPI0035698213
MIIMGVDPGIAILGYGLLKMDGNKFNIITSGAITTESTMSMPERLSYIYEELNVLLSKYNPDAYAIEELFFNKNIKTALTVGHARGVAILAASNHNVPIFEYTPLQVKQAIVGYGRAEKKQMQLMVKVLLRLDEIPKPDDVADALAVAICHGNSSKYSNLFKL